MGQGVGTVWPGHSSAEYVPVSTGATWLYPGGNCSAGSTIAYLTNLAPWKAFLEVLPGPFVLGLFDRTSCKIFVLRLLSGPLKCCWGE